MNGGGAGSGQRASLSLREQSHTAFSETLSAELYSARVPASPAAVPPESA